MDMSSFWLGASLVTGVGIAATLVVLLALPVRVTVPVGPIVRLSDRLVALFVDPPCCELCGTPAKVLGTTKRTTWWYCERCSHHWRSADAREVA